MEWSPLSMRAPTPLLGRGVDLERLSRAFESGAVVVTLLGPPGIGKTRVALAFAERTQDARPVFFLDLASSRRSDGIHIALGRALGIPIMARSRDEEEAVVARALRHVGPSLVVFDNAELVASELGVVLGSLGRRAPDAWFVVTSRSRLGLAFETVQEVATLPVTAADGSPGPAVELLLERARAAGWSGHADLAMLVGIAEKLDGLPLALELAAPRMRILSPEQLHDKLDRRLDLLQSKGPSVRPGHHSLRSVLDEAWELLDATERLALARSSVFQRSFDLASAMAVFGGVEGESDVLSALQGLCDKSLISACSSDDRNMRYSLLHSIRAYAKDKLDASGEAPLARARHAAHFAVVTPIAREDVDDVMSAIRNGAALGRKDVALRGATALADVLLCSGPLGIAAELLDTALGASGSSSPETASLELRARIARARVARSRGRPREGIGDAETALAMAKSLGDVALEAEALAEHAYAQLQLGRSADAVTAVAAFTDCGRVMSSALVATSGIMAFYEGRMEDAARLAMDLVVVAREQGDRASEARGLMNLGAAVYMLGDTARARSATESAAGLYLEIGDVLSHARASANAGLMAGDLGELEQARASIIAGIEVLERCGDRTDFASSLAQLAVVDIDAGRIDDARASLLRGLPASTAMTKPLLLAELARVAHVGGLISEASDLYERALGCASVAKARIGVWSAAAFAQLGQRSRARERLDAARAVAQEVSDRAAQNLAVLCEGLIDPEVRHEKRAFARGLPPSIDARFMARLLDAEPTARSASSAPEDAPEGALVLSSRTLQLRLPDGAVVDLSTKGHQRRLVESLIERRLSAPGQPSSVADLLSAGWPGERVLALTGANRVYVAMSALRRMGLRAHLVRRDDGYLLAPTLPVVRL
ncbi:MAG: AAA family ATPase [Polyangiaceae bacterium]|nr:AAA family ATPase [Polyangiaceae bacterium]